jgi:hypothetical protein
VEKKRMIAITVAGAILEKIFINTFSFLFYGLINGRGYIINFRKIINNLIEKMQKKKRQFLSCNANL